MSGRHARRSSVPTGLLALALVGAVGGAFALQRSLAPEASPPEPPEAAPASPTVTATPPTPSATPQPTPERSRIVIHGTGDVSLDPAYLPVFRERGYGWAWGGLGGLFRRDDLTVVNLECPPTSIVDPQVKTFVFRCDPAALPAARRAGVEVASLANNHAFDQGPDGLLDAIANLRAAGLVPLGAGGSERRADAPRYVEVGGWRIGLVGVGQVLDPAWQVAVGDEVGTAVGHDLLRALRAIRRAERRADLVVVVIHWGVELDTEPRPYQVAQAHRMVEAGADVVFGHHAHRLQPMEVYRGRPIFYGLGNFVWPRLSLEGARTAVARVVVEPDGGIRGRLLPATIVSDGRPELDR